MKLLNYTSYRYFLFAGLLTLLSIPISYLLLNRIFVDSVDRDLKLQGDLIPAGLKAIQSQRDLDLWKALDHDLDIVPADSMHFSPEPFTVKKMHKSQTVTEDFRILQKEVFILGKRYYINIESSLVENEDLIQTVLLIQLGIFFFLFSGAALINYYINKKVWRPFYANLSYLKQFKIDDPIPQAPDKKIAIEEFEQLDQSIRQLSERVQKSYYLHKEFLENISHELQTPLTLLKFKLELLLQDQMLSEEQSIVISDMYAAIEQMQDLNGSFLLLSKIENGQFNTTEQVDFTEAIEETVQELSFFIDSREQLVNRDLAAGVLLKGNKVLLKILVKNLLVNAIQYAPVATEIKLFLTPSYLEITNIGNAIEIPQSQLFERVIQKNYQKGSRTGNGLGLSIVNRIALYHKGTMAYNYQSGKHHFIFSWK